VCSCGLDAGTSFFFIRNKCCFSRVWPSFAVFSSVEFKGISALGYLKSRREKPYACASNLP
jgi:hypothetical protein